jgi:hypothetical protein
MEPGWRGSVDRFRSPTARLGAASRQGGERRCFFLVRASERTSRAA